MNFLEMMRLEAHGPDTFVASGPDYPWGGLYGGQIVAQGGSKALLTCAFVDRTTPSARALPTSGRWFSFDLRASFFIFLF